MKNFKTEIRNVFEKGLKPYGFVKAKCKNPYYVRLINEEILHVITYRENTPLLPNYKSFFVLFGVATVYKKELPFEKSIQETQEWLSSLSVLPYREEKFDAYKETIPFDFTFIAADEMAMFRTIDSAFALTKKCVIPVLDEIDSLEACIEHYYKYVPSVTTIMAHDNHVSGPWCTSYGEGLLNIKVYGKEREQDFISVVTSYYKTLSEQEIERMRNGLCGFTLEEHEAAELRRQTGLKRTINEFKLLVSEQEWRKKVDKELEYRKNKNIELLSKYEIVTKEQRE